MRAITPRDPDRVLTVAYSWTDRRGHSGPWLYSLGHTVAKRFATKSEKECFLFLFSSIWCLMIWTRVFPQVHTTKSSQWSVKAKVMVCVRAQDALCDSHWSDWTEYRSVPHSLVYCIQQNLSSRTASHSMHLNYWRANTTDSICQLIIKSLTTTESGELVQA